jgi:mannan endo-1,4-beta-mannosidase
MTHRLLRLVLPLVLALGGCATAPVRGTAPQPVLADKAATPQTRALFRNLLALAPSRTLFGHQNTLAYGHDWVDEPGRSDVKEVAGAYPAVYGWDVMDIFGTTDRFRYDPVRADRLRRWILEGYARGGVITLSWHMPNPVARTDAWDVKTRAVERILPGGDHHAAYLEQLDTAARFFASLRAQDGTMVPVIFRPYHEHTGSWFWWGRDHASVDQFVALWRMTVARMRDHHRLHNLLYAYSTDVFDSEAAYLERYPGDDVIDVLGFDDYHGIKSRETLPKFEARLKMLVTMARARRKIPAVTETGLEAIPNPIWWTDVLGRGLNADPAGAGIAWVLVWRNANRARENREHFYAPYPGQASAEDFVRFTRHPRILLENELPDLYDRTKTR